MGRPNASKHSLIGLSEGYGIIFAMSKKKAPAKKHKFKHVSANGTSAPEASSAEQSLVGSNERVARSETKPAQKSAPTTIGAVSHQYVGRDMRRILVAAVALISLELVLYVIMTRTSVGPAIYNLIQV